MQVHIVDNSNSEVQEKDTHIGREPSGPPENFSLDRPHQIQINDMVGDLIGGHGKAENQAGESEKEQILKVDEEIDKGGSDIRATQ
jgi:hypothetical protein